MHQQPKAPKYYGKLAKQGLVWGFLRVGTNTFLQLPTAVVLARLLTPAEFGISAAASFFLQLASRLTQFGFGVSLVRIKTLRREHASSVFLANLTLGVSAWLGLTLIAPLIADFFRSQEIGRVLPTAGLGFVLVSAGSVPTALLSRDMRWRENAVSDWIGTLAGSVLSIVLAWKGFSYWSLVYGQLVNQGLTTCARFWIVRWKPSLRFSPDAMRELFSFGVGIYAKNLLEYASQNLDNLVVGRLLGVTALGYYDKAFNFTSKLITNINLAGPGVSFRVFALIHDERERFRRAYRKVVLTVTLVGYPVLSAMIVMAPSLIEVLFGTRWLQSVVPFQILCGAAMLKLLNTYASSATQAKGMIWSEVKRQTAFICLLVIAVAALSPFGIAGAAAGVLFAVACMTVLMQRLVKNLAGLSWRDMLGPQVPALLCSLQIVVALVVTRVAMNAWIGHPRAVWVVAVSSAVASCSGLAFVLFAPIQELREIVGETIEDLAPALAKWMPAALVTPKKLSAYSER